MLHHSYIPIKIQSIPHGKYRRARVVNFFLPMAVLSGISRHNMYSRCQVVGWFINHYLLIINSLCNKLPNLFKVKDLVSLFMGQLWKSGLWLLISPQHYKDLTIFWISIVNISIQTGKICPASIQMSEGRFWHRT